MSISLKSQPSSVVAKLGEYAILRYESTFTTRAALVKNLDVLLPFDYQDWVDHPTIEYWMKEYVEEAYKEYKAKYEQIEEFMREGVVIEDAILDVDNTLIYYGGFGNKEGV